MKINIHVWSYLTHFFLEWGMFQTTLAQKIKTRFKFSNFFPETHAIYNWLKNVVEPNRPQVTIWRTRIACWIPETTNTYSEYIPLTVFPLQQWLHEGVSVLSYTYIAFLAPFTLESRGRQFTNLPWRLSVTQSSRFCSEEWFREGGWGEQVHIMTEQCMIEFPSTFPVSLI
jgi:hypothetical protein